MKATAELALRALDATLGDGKWSTCVTPPSGSKPGETFQWSDKGINATNVTVPPDWASGPVLVRLHRTPVAPRLPPPSANVKERPLRANWADGNFPIVGVAQTTPVKFSTEWKEVFKAAGIRKEDLSDPVKAARIQLALALSWDAAAALPELQGFTDKLEDLITELNAKQAKGPGNGRFGLKPTGLRSQSGRFVPNSSQLKEWRSEPDSEYQTVGGHADPAQQDLNFRANLRKPRPPPPKQEEMSELDKIREKIAQKMKARLAEMEQQDVADSWDDQTCRDNRTPKDWV
ncbi:hypothetical protein Ctob_003348 [Chrysochromulina tobinii]|uniref:Uncharacterized protein n=1 Tax=Chrysochromulina tobinii TaxID=1460289 RepID=A0A0M0J7M6_9EUKA|nr:hypothetical protein Ctob_003348 [Chrysochromulina tobinii]|eukprot:KOO22591.1 hypothetical protein Ctob_003348 [Chrysochromulina sp. CCMP291]